jgi:DNA-binding MarR family transcriptional regulator
MTAIYDIEILAFLLTDNARLLRSAFERRIAEAGLGITPAEARTLLSIHALRDCRQLDIAVRMGIEPMTVCSFLDKLQSQGLIERHPDPDDRRAKRVRLTETSLPVIAAIRTELRGIISQATQGMSDSEQQALCRALDQLANNFLAQGASLPQAGAK